MAGPEVESMTTTNGPLYEYRVSWQREGMKRVRAIRQTEAGAKAKVEALLWSEAEKRKRGHYDADGGYSAEGDYLRDMPDLTGEPTIERRVVGGWESA